MWRLLSGVHTFNFSAQIPIQTMCDEIAIELSRNTSFITLLVCYIREVSIYIFVDSAVRQLYNLQNKERKASAVSHNCQHDLCVFRLHKIHLSYNIIKYNLVVCDSQYNDPCLVVRTTAA